MVEGNNAVAEPSVTPATPAESQNESNTENTESSSSDEGDTDPKSTDGVEPEKKDASEQTENKDNEDNQSSPESYSDFVMPEGVELDAPLMEKAIPLFKELGLNQEQAQKLIDFQTATVKEGQQVEADRLSNLIEGWKQDSLNDKEIGGDKFDQNLSVAFLAMDKFATPELKQLMEDHGIGSNPEMIRFMFKVGQTLKEDVPGAVGGVTSTKENRITSLYGTQSK